MLFLGGILITRLIPDIAEKNDLSGDQILSMLDLPNLKTSELGAPVVKKKKRRSRRVEVKPINIEIKRDEGATNGTPDTQAAADNSSQTRVINFEPFKKFEIKKSK